MPIDVSIIIVNYKTSKLINNCIRSVFDKTEGIAYEIIIVDNATEQLAEVIESAADPRVKFIQLPENVGFGRANNAGAKIAAGRNLFFLNPDTILLNNAIKILSNYLDANPRCGACGGNLYDVNLNPTLSYRRILPGIKWEINELFHQIPEKVCYGKNRLFNQSTRPLNVAYITGADLIVRKCIYELLSGFSSDFFMYYEETDLCSRIHNLNLRITSVPSACIQHLEGKSLTRSSNTAKIEFIETSRLKYHKNNHNKICRWFINRIYLFFLITRIIFLKGPGLEYYKLRLSIFHNLLKQSH